MSKFSKVLVFVLISSTFISCVTRNEKLRKIDELVYNQEFEQAIEEIDKSKDELYNKNKDKVLYLSDTGLLSLYADQLDTSRVKLEEADTLIEEARTKSISEGVGAALINDTLLTYGGIAYESVFVSLMLSLGYLAQGDFDKGFVEMRRTQDKITRIQNDYSIWIDNYEQNEDSFVELDRNNTGFVDSAFVRLLSFWLYRADEDFTNMEVAARKYNDAILSQPGIYSSFNPPLMDVDNVLDYDTSKTKIHVVAKTGRVPFRISKRYAFNSVPNGLIITIQEENADFAENGIEVVDNSGVEVLRTGAIIPIPGMPTGVSLIIELPFMARVYSDVDSISIEIDGNPAGSLTLTESMENMALAGFDAESALIYAKTITRAIGKMIAGVAVDQGLRSTGDEALAATGQIAGLILQVLNNVSEKADLRTVRYYPAHIWTGEIDAPADRAETITYIYKDGNGTELMRKEKPLVLNRQVGSLTFTMDSFLR